jgi:hypothetical protein
LLFITVLGVSTMPHFLPLNGIWASLF